MTNETHWNIRPGERDNAPGILEHLAEPRFCAFWQTGSEGLENIDGPFWYDEASGSDDDSFVIFGFDWDRHPPSAEEFEGLMNQAVRALEQWIMSLV